MKKIEGLNRKGVMVTLYVGTQENVDKILSEVENPDIYKVSNATNNNRSWYVNMIKQVTLKALLAQSKIHNSLTYDQCFTLTGIAPNRRWKAYYDHIDSNSSNRQWNPVLWYVVKSYKASLLATL